VGSRVAIRQTLSRISRSVALLAAAALIVLAFVPVVFGPAFGGVARALGIEPEHACACGMKAGTCGCPECERALKGDTSRLPETQAVLGSCDDHGRASLGAALPPGLLPPCIGLPVRLHATLLATTLTTARVPFEPQAPPTPPPRFDAA
jgi:hypothetical protein